MRAMVEGVESRRPWPQWLRPASSFLSMYHHARGTLSLSSKTTRHNFLAADILSGLPPRKPLLFGNLRVYGNHRDEVCRGALRDRAQPLVSGGPTPRMSPSRRRNEMWKRDEAVKPTSGQPA